MRPVAAALVNLIRWNGDAHRVGGGATARPILVVVLVVTFHLLVGAPFPFELSLPLFDLLPVTRIRIALLEVLLIPHHPTLNVGRQFVNLGSEVRAWGEPE